MARLALLSAREREVLEQVLQGRLNKQIAFDLGIAEKTVKRIAAGSWKRWKPIRSRNSSTCAIALG